MCNRCFLRMIHPIVNDPYFTQEADLSTPVTLIQDIYTENRLTASRLELYNTYVDPGVPLQLHVEFSLLMD